MNHPNRQPSPAWPVVSPHIRLLGADDLEPDLSALAALLCEAVNAGAGLGFLAPLSHEEALAYWRSLAGELRAGTRLLLVASVAGQVVASGQLAMVPWAAARHRAEVQKVIVAGAMQGRGLGRDLLAALHGTARRRGRSLMQLSTRRGGPPEGFYKRLGYRELGVLPGGSIGAAGERHDVVMLYQELVAAVAAG